MVDEDEHDVWNRPTVDYSERAIGRVPHQRIPYIPEAPEPAPQMLRAGRLTDKARARTIPADRFARRRNRGPEWPLGPA